MEVSLLLSSQLRSPGAKLIEGRVEAPTHKWGFEVEHRDELLSTLEMEHRGVLFGNPLIQHYESHPMVVEWEDNI